MAETIIITFAGDTDLKAMLEDWAKKEERSVSWIIRKAIEAERIRRMKQLPLAELTDEAGAADESPAAQMKINGAAQLIPVGM